MKLQTRNNNGKIMQTKCLSLLSLSILVTLSACSTNESRTRYSDKNMRIMLYPETISPDHFARIQTALVRSDVWSVLDRSQGLKAVKQEQNIIHKAESDRYDDKEKYAHWGKLYGVGAIVIAHAQCTNKASKWNVTELRTYCQQFLNLVDSNTGEVVLGVEAENDSDYGSTPDWNEVTKKLADEYPKYFNKEKVTERLERYKEESKERAVREEEKPKA